MLTFRRSGDGCARSGIGWTENKTVPSAHATAAVTHFIDILPRLRFALSLGNHPARSWPRSLRGRESGQVRKAFLRPANEEEWSHHLPPARATQSVDRTCP